MTGKYGYYEDDDDDEILYYKPFKPPGVAVIEILSDRSIFFIETRLSTTSSHTDWCLEIFLAVHPNSKLS
jgi:hypothetical protein